MFHIHTGIENTTTTSPSFTWYSINTFELYIYWGHILTCLKREVTISPSFVHLPICYPNIHPTIHPIIHHLVRCSCASYKCSSKMNIRFIILLSRKQVWVGKGLASTKLFLLLTTILRFFNLKYFIDPKNLNSTPITNEFTSVQHSYQFCFISIWRRAPSGCCCAVVQYLLVCRFSHIP
jgi:hypothetical protein